MRLSKIQLIEINKVFLKKELKLEKQVGFVKEEYADKNLDLKLWVKL